MVVVEEEVVAVEAMIEVAVDEGGGLGWNMG